MYGLIKPLLFQMDAERAHDLVFDVLGGAGGVARAAASAVYGPPDPRLRCTFAGLDLLGPIGLAAGLDKNARVPDFWPALGFGFVEVGTVTAHAQSGNPKPRLFRFPDARALVNRMGFNNDGAEQMAARLEQGSAARGRPVRAPLGINLGKSKVTPLEEAVDDYAFSAERLAHLADYLVVNVSSPNTPGLRSLQDASFLADITRAVVERSAGRPVFVKLAPDLTFEAIDDAVRVAADAGARAIIATNTTIERPGISAQEAEAVGAGGLSGAPLRERSLAVIRHVASHGALPVIGVGGISRPAHVLDALAAGADVVQIYSALIFEGPGLVKRLWRGVSAEMDRRGVADMDALRAALRAASA